MYVPKKQSALQIYSSKTSFINNLISAEEMKILIRIESDILFRRVAEGGGRLAQPPPIFSKQYDYIITKDFSNVDFILFEFIQKDSIQNQSTYQHKRTKITVRPTEMQK